MGLIAGVIVVKHLQDTNQKKEYMKFIKLKTNEVKKDLSD
jgi:hypothetical protein